jgi:hypothetical protein
MYAAALTAAAVLGSGGSAAAEVMAVACLPALNGAGYTYAPSFLGAAILTVNKPVNKQRGP